VTLFNSRLTTLKKLSWLRTSCADSITTVATLWSVPQKNWTAMNTIFWHNLIKRSIDLNKISQITCVQYS